MCVFECAYIYVRMYVCMYLVSVYVSMHMCVANPALALQERAKVCLALLGLIEVFITEALGKGLDRILCHKSLQSASNTAGPWGLGFWTLSDLLMRVWEIPTFLGFSPWETKKIMFKAEDKPVASVCRGS